MFDEKETVNSILNGNMRAFELLVKQYQRLVGTVLYRMLKNNQDVEDVGQEVFMKIYKNLYNFKFESKLSTWIIQIAYTMGINYIKSSKKHQYNDLHDSYEELIFTNENPETETIKTETNQNINHLIDELPLQYRTVITLYHLNEFSYQEIEKITGMPEGTVKGYLFRARKILKTKLEQSLKKDTL